MKQEFEEKFTHLNNLGGNRSMATVNADRVWQWIETKIDEAKEEGFNAGCDYTCKQYGDGKTEAQIIDEACKKAKIEENEYWIDFKNKDWTNLIHTTSLQNRIRELSQKESE